MSPHFVLGRENVPCVAEVVNRSLKADCTDFTLVRLGHFSTIQLAMGGGGGGGARPLHLLSSFNYP